MCIFIKYIFIFSLARSIDVNFILIDFYSGQLDAETDLRQEYLQMCWPGLVKSNEEWWDWEYTN